MPDPTHRYRVAKPSAERRRRHRSAARPSGPAKPGLPGSTAVAARSLVLLVMGRASPVSLSTRLFRRWIRTPPTLLTQVWQTGRGLKPTFGIAAHADRHTMITGLLAMTLAVPVSIGIALFINFYGPSPAGRPGWAISSTYWRRFRPRVRPFGITILGPAFCTVSCAGSRNTSGGPGFLHTAPDNDPQQPCPTITVRGRNRPPVGRTDIAQPGRPAGDGRRS